jgi:hypothetical protein
VTDAIPDGRCAGSVHDTDMDKAVVERTDRGFVLLAEFALALGHHGFVLFRLAAIVDY